MTRTIPYEDLISRVGGLFPYIEYDKEGKGTIKNALTNINGCYGQVIPNLQVNFSFVNSENNIQVFKSGDSVSYRTLLNHYYRIKDYPVLTTDEQNLISFIDKGIGKIKVTGVTGDLVPDYINSCEVQEMLDWFTQYKPICANPTDEYCCICQEYQNKGGDTMFTFLTNCKPTVTSTANYYYSLAQEGYVNFQIPLFQTMDDGGIFSIYAKDWIPSKKYYKNDIVFYNSKTYRCNINENETESGLYDKETGLVLFNISSWNILLFKVSSPYYTISMSQVY
jgi:hypothetical protein